MFLNKIGCNNRYLVRSHANIMLKTRIVAYLCVMWQHCVYTKLPSDVTISNLLNTSSRVGEIFSSIRKPLPCSWQAWESMFLGSDECGYRE